MGKLAGESDDLVKAALGYLGLPELVLCVFGRYVKLRGRHLAWGMT